MSGMRLQWQLSVSHATTAIQRLCLHEAVIRSAILTADTDTHYRENRQQSHVNTMHSLISLFSMNKDYFLEKSKCFVTDLLQQNNTKVSIPVRTLMQCTCVLPAHCIAERHLDIAQAQCTTRLLAIMDGGRRLASVQLADVPHPLLYHLAILLSILHRLH